MHINGRDAAIPGIARPHTADYTLQHITSRRSRRLSARSSTTSSSAAATSSDRDSFTTAWDTFARPQSELGYKGSSNDALRPRMGSTTTITAAAAAQAGSGLSNWPGGIIRETNFEVETRELAGLDAELRRRSKHLPRDDGGKQPGREHEVLRDLADFLRDVTPPPENYMSLRTPSPSPSLSSGGSSVRRKTQKVSTFKRCLGVLMRKKNGKTKQLSKRRSNTSLNNSAARAPSVRKRAWPSRIRLPDTAVAGTTVEGHRHIAISIPLEYAHIGPEPRYRFPRRDKRRQSASKPEQPPRIYTDVNIRPLSALVSEPHIGTQLGPVAEERESLSSKTPSWENSAYGSSSGAGGLHPATEALKVRLASRNTFGTVHEEFQSPSGSISVNNSRPATRSGSSPTRTPLTPPQRSSSDEYARPRTPLSSGRSSSDEIVHKSDHRMGALNALNSATSRPSSSSAHSLRSFASASPGGTTGRVYYPKRNSSLQPSGTPGTASDNAGGRTGRGRGLVAQGQTLQTPQQRNHSRESSRDQYTLHESIFSEPSYLESSHTVDTGGDAAPGPVISRVATRDGPSSRRDSGDGKRWSLGSTGHAADSSNRPTKQSPLAGRVLTASKSAGSLTRPSTEDILSAVASGQSDNSKQSGAEAEDTAARAEAAADSSTRPGNSATTSGQAKHLGLMASPELIEGQLPASHDNAKERELPIDQSSPESLKKSVSHDSGDIQIHITKPVSSPKERREHRKTVLLSRKQRIAQLRATLGRPGAQPGDLIWDGRLSTSSEESISATPRVSPSSSPWRERYSSSSRTQRRRPMTLPAHLSFTPVVTVADVRPYSPAGSSEGSRASVSLQRKESIPLSLSSPATLATIVKASPVPPFSVTPPQSPHVSPSSPSTPSPSSELYPQHDSQCNSVTSTPLRPQPALKRLSSVRRRASIVGRSSSAGGDLGGRLSSLQRGGIGPDTTPSRPKTAGKGGIMGSRRKDYFSGAFAHGQSQHTLSSPFTSPTVTSSSGTSDQDATGAGAVATGSGSGKAKSALKLTRSELFERYEAVRDKQTRDLERRLRKLEKHGDYWLTSMMPLLTEMSQTLGQLALGGSERQNLPQQQGFASRKGKERAVMEEEANENHDEQVRRAFYADGRKSRFGSRSTPAVHLAGLEPFQSERPSTSTLDPLDGMPRRHARGQAHTRAPGRLYLKDGSGASHHPGLGYRVRLEDHELAQPAEVGQRDQSLGASSLTTTPNRFYERASTKSTPSRKYDQYRQAPSGSSTMVDTTSIQNAARADSLGKTPGSFRTIHRSSSSLHDEYRQQQHHKTNSGGKPSYAIHANAPLCMSTARLLSEQVAFERERLARVERLNDHIDARMRSLPSASSENGGAGFLATSRFPKLANRSHESLETYQGSSSEDESETEENDGRNVLDMFGGRGHRDQRQRAFMGSPESPFSPRRGTGMELVTPLMRELQANGSRLSLESDGSCAEGDNEVRALRKGPEPRRVVEFGAFR